MNILPKKRWHVRNRDNKERVRKDEENARLEEEREKQRIAIAEQEARTSLLRAKSGKSTSSIKPAVTEGKDICLYQGNGHFNLFALEEQEGESSGKKDNKEYIAEKKAEKEDYEKKIGLLTYLGQSAAESKECVPWYLEKRKEVKSDDEKGHSKNIVEDQRDKSRKERLDPIHIVETNLKKMKRDSDHKKKKKKKKNDKKEKFSSSIAQLREERLRRERAERARAEELLGGNKSQETTESNSQR